MKTLLAAFFLIYVSSASACPLLEQVETISSHFKQTRQIAGIKMPIVSSGNFNLIPGKEVIWETIEPFYNKVVISDEGFKVQEQVYAEGPLKQLSSVLLKLHSGNLKPLEEQFLFKCEKAKDQKYHLIATPKDSDLARVFKELEIIGSLEPEQIIFTDARGDKSQVEFSK